jgi:hypothetical protein
MALGAAPQHGGRRGPKFDEKEDEFELLDPPGIFPLRKPMPLKAKVCKNGRQS